MKMNEPKWAALLIFPSTPTSSRLRSLIIKWDKATTKNANYAQPANQNVAVKEKTPTFCAYTADNTKKIGSKDLGGTGLVLKVNCHR
jgi:hypothetical protein